MTRVCMALEMLTVIIYSQLYAKLFIKVISGSYRGKSTLGRVEQKCPVLGNALVSFVRTTGF